MEPLSLDDHPAEPAQVRRPLEPALDRLCQELRRRQDVLDQVADSLVPLAGMIGQQTRYLEQIASQLQTMSEATQALTGVLQSLPKSSREQSEKLDLIGDHLQGDQQRDRMTLEFWKRLDGTSPPWSASPKAGRNS